MSRLCVLMALLFVVATARANDFQEGNQLYEKGQFAEAKKRYEAAAQAGNITANLFYNLGNTAFRLGDPGAAALHYERALALAPQHAEAQANLLFVREKTGAKTPAHHPALRAFPQLPANTFLIAGTAAAWCAVFCLTAIFLRLGRGGVRGLAVLSLLIAAYCGAGVFFLEKERNTAVVVAGKVEARYAPAENSTLADTLPAGSKVHVRGEHGEWWRCTLPNGNDGWLPARSVERVRRGTG